MATWTMRAAGLRHSWPEGPGTYTEDDFRCEPDAVVIGHGCGAIGGQGRPAGKLAVWSVIAELEREGAREARLRAGLVRADEAVARLSWGWEGLITPFATAAALCRDGDGLLTAHVGDCRISRCRVDRLEPVTIDHTLAVEHPELTAYPHMVTRVLGRSGAAEVARLAVRGDDRFALATPSVHRALADDELAVLIGGADDLDAACARVIGAVEARVAYGSAMICVVQLGSATATSSGSSRRPASSWLFAPGRALPPAAPRWAPGGEGRGPDSRWFAEVYGIVMGEDD